MGNAPPTVLRQPPAPPTRRQSPMAGNVAEGSTEPPAPPTRRRSLMAGNVAEGSTEPPAPPTRHRSLMAGNVAEGSTKPAPPTRHQSLMAGNIAEGSTKLLMPLRPHRSLMAGYVAEGDTEMVGGTYYLRKRKRLRDINSLPDDLLFNILLNLSSQEIYEQARLVCRRWYHMTRSRKFVYAHLQNTTNGLLLCAVPPFLPVFIALRQGRIGISSYNYKFRVPIWTSCNGLILEYDLQNFSAIYVGNPATKQIFILPQFFMGLQCRTFTGMAYAPASMEYKVYGVYNVSDPVESKRRRCAILTVGVDKSWRNVDTEHLSLRSKRALISKPLITEGFVHWVWGDCVLSMNVETEIITETSPPIPQVDESNYTNMYYLSTGRYLSLLITSGKFSWQVLEMKPETGEWRELPSISLEAQKCRYKEFGFIDDHVVKPLGWLKYLEVFMFGAKSAKTAGFDGTGFIFYNLVTDEIGLIESVPLGDYFKAVVHRNSLVWSSGC